MLLIYIFGIVAAFISLLTKNKKWAFFSAICAFLLLTCVRTGNDVTNYYNGYSSSTLNYGREFFDEWLYSFIEVRMKNLNIDFYWFKAILTFAAILIQYNIIKNYTSNWGFILCHYYLFLIFIDCQQFRNFLALTLLLIGIHFFVRYNNKIGYIICNFFAIGIHTSFVFYYAFLLIYKKISKRLIKILGICACAFVLLCMYNREILDVLEMLSIFFEDSKGRIDVYLGVRTSWGFLPPAILHILGLFLFIREKKVLKDHLDSEWQIPKWTLNGFVLKKERKSFKVYSIVDFLYYSNILMLFMIPFSMLSLVFYRFLRNAYYLNLIAYSIISVHLKDNKSEKIIFNIAVLAITLLWIWYDAFIYYGFEETFDLILNGTLFWVS